MGLSGRKEPEAARPPEAQRGPYRWHLAALVWSGLVVAYGWAAQPTPEELLARLEQGRPTERMWALHAISQRAPERLDAALVQSLVRDPDARVGELVFTNVISRHWGKQALMPLLEALEDHGQRERAKLWLLRDVASYYRLTRPELQHYFTTFTSEPSTR